MNSNLVRTVAIWPFHFLKMIMRAADSLFWMIVFGSKESVRGGRARVKVPDSWEFGKASQVISKEVLGPF